MQIVDANLARPMRSRRLEGISKTVLEETTIITCGRFEGCRGVTRQ